MSTGDIIVTLHQHDQDTRPNRTPCWHNQVKTVPHIFYLCKLLWYVSTATHSNANYEETLWVTKGCGLAKTEQTHSLVPNLLGSNPLYEGWDKGKL